MIGAGLVGLATARELQARDSALSVVVIDRAGRVAAGQSGHNSGVVHAGIYYRPGSAKAELCREGRELLYEFCAEHGIAHERSGKLIVASTAAELGRLDELERRGRANAVPGLRRLDRGGLREIEPHCEGIAALHSPQTGIVDFPAVARELAAQIKGGGGRLLLGAAAEAIERGPGGVRIRRAGGDDVLARRVVVCAGLGSDRFAEPRGELRIVPFRGRYLRLRAPARVLVRSMIYPVPDPELPFLGVHLTRTVGGEVILGPTALPLPTAATIAWPGSWRMARRWWRAAARELPLNVGRRAVVRVCARFVPELSAADVTAGFAGVRAQALDRGGELVDDFVFGGDGAVVNVRNAPSPAATSSLAIARRIADRVVL